MVVAKIIARGDGELVLLSDKNARTVIENGREFLSKLAKGEVEEEVISGNVSIP